LKFLKISKQKPFPNSKMTSYQCSVCPKTILDLCETTRKENKECQQINNKDDCTCDSINNCKYCDYFLCDQCNNSEEHKEDFHFAYTNAEDVCFKCLKAKPICVSCHSIFPDDSSYQIKLEKCEICHWKVCPSCTKLTDNLHFTAKKVLCLDCNNDWKHRPMYVVLGEWYRIQYAWFHDGCLRTAICKQCGREWCLEHDSNKLHQCIDPVCPDIGYGPDYCDKCIGKHYENAGYCYGCVSNDKIMKINVI